MRCSRARAALLGSREIGAELSGPLREHLSECASCRRDLAVLQAVQRSLAARGGQRCPVDLAPAVTEQVLGQSLLERGRSRPTWGRRLVLAASAATAAVALWCLPGPWQGSAREPAPALQAADSEIVESYVEAYAEFRNVQSPAGASGASVMLVGFTGAPETGIGEAGR